MSRARTPVFETFQLLKSATESFSNFENELKTLKRKRLIRADVWSGEVSPAMKALARALDQAWYRLHDGASSSKYFPELIREEDVIEQFQISQKTLYRRRKQRELPYVKDTKGVIWYPIYDLLDYVLKAKVSDLKIKPGRPRKF